MDVPCDATRTALDARSRQRPSLRQLMLALVWVFVAEAAYAEDEQPRVADPEEDRKLTQPQAEERTNAQFLAFLEYLGSWEESDEEWQAFHPDEGLSEIRLPAPSERGVQTQADGNEDTWDEKGRS